MLLKRSIPPLPPLQNFLLGALLTITAREFIVVQSPSKIMLLILVVSSVLIRFYLVQKHVVMRCQFLTLSMMTLSALIALLFIRFRMKNYITFAHVVFLKKR